MSTPAKTTAAMEYEKLTPTQLHAELVKNPRHAILHFALSKKYVEEGKLESATFHALQAAEIGVARASHYSHLAKTLMAARLPRMAELALHDALNKGLQAPQIYYRLAQALAKQRQWQNAVQAVDYAISLAPEQAAYKRYRERLLARNVATPTPTA
jgi:predicted Zn-dependent protease